MKILIITTYYPPDTAIAAVRPYMFAKYLTQFGHDVTVLRSGEIGHGYSSFYEKNPNVRVISFMGENAPAERFERGESLESLPKIGKGRLHFLPSVLRNWVVRVYYALFTSPCSVKGKRIIRERVEKQKDILDSLRNDQFDVVFSTYGMTENIYAGQYASQLFDCPLIQDFRDPLANREVQDWYQYSVLKRIQKKAIEMSDICTAVSEGVLDEICDDTNRRKGVVIYNGYEPTIEDGKTDSQTLRKFSFSYTGQLYVGMQDFSPMLKAIRHLSDEGKVSLDKVRIHYAGRDFAYLYQQAEKYRVTDILVDHGYVDRKEAARIQAGSDMYVVLSWNTRKEKGVLTGKLYEGIRAQKPILAIVAGDAPNSELSMINEKYNYGFCYESCREKEQFGKFCAYLEQAYKEKMQYGKVCYNTNSEMAIDFRYDTLSRQLENICLELIRKNKKK